MINTNQQTHVKLYREVKNSIRYYFIDIYKNLFDEYIVQKKYGSVKNIRPTGVKVEYFKSLESALIAMRSVVTIKAKKGYKKYDLDIKDKILIKKKKEI